MFCDLSDFWMWHVEIFLQVSFGSFEIMLINVTLKAWIYKEDLWKKGEGRAVQSEADLVLLNINVCFVGIPFQEDPAPAVERLNDKDYLFRAPRETADW